MGKPKQRNHYVPRYVPRFLLNRFASRSGKNQHYVWQVSADEPPIEVNTRNAAVQRHFYGKEDSRLEDALSQLETQFSGVLAALDNGSDPNEFSCELRKMIWIHIVRTQAVRVRFASAADRLMSSIGSAFSLPQAREFIIREMEDRYDEMIAEELLKLSPLQQHIARGVLHHPATRMALLQQAAEGLTPEFLAGINSLIQETFRARGGMAQAAANGQIKGLENLTAAQSTAPESFNPKVWTVRRYPARSLLLGDTGVVTVSKDHDIGPYFKMGTNWLVAYLPISHHSALIAWEEREAPIFTAHELNRASASISDNRIFLPELYSHHRELSSLIGTRADPVGKPELDELIANAFRGGT